MEENLLFSCRDLTVKFEEKTILDSVSIDIYKKDSVAIIGSSGSGKSTLMRVLLGFKKPSFGSVLYKNEELNNANVLNLRKDISVLFQEPKLFGDTVEEILFQPFSFNHNKELIPSKDDIKQLFKDMMLSTDLLGKSIDTVSGGEKQRIALIRSLLLKRSVIFADEPTSALDSKSRDLLSKKLFNSEKTVIIVTHDNSVARLCGKVFRIENGKIVSGVGNANN